MDMAERGYDKQTPGTAQPGQRVPRSRESGENFEDGPYDALTPLASTGVEQQVVADVQGRCVDALAALIADLDTEDVRRGLAA